ncbi:hypothetical protein HCN44_008659 [Aphidius gifuensis]|uniref:Tubulin epsilon and delta complex protein 1 domain-containing protein n=1 Tax=Aphidius gifuensis TaxID=684658 RepID=A0A834XMV0_APHGI|nr:uncharacterized protein LOC122858406 [Aphidius gifuensis]KAF7989985.1 hypothetical protein HCN44_008659 [Aphidius gifuensis]
MTDIKKTINYLCQCIELCTGHKIKPEYFESFNQNKSSPEAINCFWSVLHTLSHFAVKNIQPTVEFPNYDIVETTKLHFGFLQYSGIYFYGLQKNDENICELVLALAWLIAKQNILETIVRSKIIDSILSGNIHQNVDNTKTKNDGIKKKLDFSSQINTVMHKSMLISYNLKGLTKIIEDKIKTTAKIHTASSNCSGILHLDPLEAAIIKRYNSNNKNYTKIDEEIMNDLNKIKSILNVYFKFSKNENIFFHWITTVMKELEIKKTEISKETIDQLSTFISILRNLVKKKIYSVKKNDNDIKINEISVTSKLQRENNTNNNNLNNKVNEKLKNEEENIAVKLKIISNELAIMLKSIPNCLQV